MCNTQKIITITLKERMEKKPKLFYSQGKFCSIPSFWSFKSWVLNDGHKVFICKLDKVVQFSC